MLVPFLYDIKLKNLVISDWLNQDSKRVLKTKYLIRMNTNKNIKLH